MPYRWATHRVVDSTGTEAIGTAPISLWWIARAAAEETLQGGAMVPAWLTLFQSHLSAIDLHNLRWADDLAVSTELRRSYSGLYGRFVARALLTHHLGLTRFNSLTRNGIALPHSITVSRSSDGDIPDWLAWDRRRRKFVLCEAKGSLSGTDFLTGDPPSCIRKGKEQFGRVSSTVAGRSYRPDEWVAATLWSTDTRSHTPVTILWDPPVEQAPFSPDEAEHHQRVITRAWLDSIAVGFGVDNADAILRAAKEDQTVEVRATPGPSPERPVPPPDPRELPLEEGLTVKVDHAPEEFPSSERQFRDEREREGGDVSPQLDLPAPPPDRRPARPMIELAASAALVGPSILEPRPPEAAPFQGAFLTALVTRLGVRPIRTKRDFETLQIAQERARSFGEPAMLIGLPRDISPERDQSGVEWSDAAGVVAPNDLAVFDLRVAEAVVPGNLPR
ncbi:hypothetical protein QE385_003170 [Sphingomonas sp. SORGH_AS 950]|uniref:hypothetical protein n=1 Tax=Sphingomonas sp. SORGH_AS_0950 TaxID=3041792 RepID=UPI0027844480|nr:hypothetical protein [Sphingomonas sp. SORGH_AS_0950]MDQ1158843.1 hypothetical protein [Sphingomonas sp. SORGH_AS_0950]